MALGLPTDQRGQIMLLLVVAALAGGYFFWTKKHKPDIATITADNQESDSLERIVAAAKADLASGSIEDLRRRVEEYQGSLELMRRLGYFVTESSEHNAEYNPWFIGKSDSRGDAVERYHIPIGEYLRRVDANLAEYEATKSRLAAGETFDIEHSGDERRRDRRKQRLFLLHDDGEPPLGLCHPRPG